MTTYFHDNYVDYKLKQYQSGYSGNHKSIYIIPIGDLHFGNKFYNPEYLDKVFKFIDKHRNRCRIILMGDLFEVATKTSVGRGVYDENYPTYDQYKTGIRLFKPYKDLIDLVIQGNHEERIIRDTSFDIIEEFCERLEVPQAYGNFEGMVNVTFDNGMTYSLYAFHGSTGGTKEGSAINALLKMKERAMSHIYLMGHTHKLLDFSRTLSLPNPGGDEAVVIPQMFVNTGTALGDGGYGTMKGLPLQEIGFGAIQVFSDKRKMVFHKIEDLID